MPIKDLEHGMISVDQDSYQLDDSVVITANPDSGYVCIDIIINGVSYGSEIVNDRLTVNFDRKVLNITAVFIDENSKTEDKTVNFPDADGLEVRLVKGGTVVENSTKTVAACLTTALRSSTTSLTPTARLKQYSRRPCAVRICQSSKSASSSIAC